MGKKKKSLIGWREWVSFPDLGIGSVKAKIDTGARTSALHTYFIDEVEGSEIRRIRFGVHPVQGDDSTEVMCEADVLEERKVTDSGGRSEVRPVIETTVSIGGISWPIEVTLTCRENMRFRLLLGRTAVRSRCVVDPGRSYLASTRQRIVK